MNYPTYPEPDIRGSLVAELHAVRGELYAQNMKWGDQDGHSMGKWLAILMEEVGEAAVETLDEDFQKLHDELIQVAAVAVQYARWASLRLPMTGRDQTDPDSVRDR